MTKYELLKSMSIDELAEWLDKYGMQDYAPWDVHFDKNYCNCCEPVDNGVVYDFAYCELNGGKCRFFPDMEEYPHGKQVVKLWLESEAE